ncbi:MAG: hypothetical protein V3U86_13955 [Acidobacteriota bacterium]|nr:hypothetical protein [Acidobacteriota bacterium]
MPPLDGFWIVTGFLPEKALHHYESLRPYGILLLYGLILSPVWRRWVLPAVEEVTSRLLAA